MTTSFNPNLSTDFAPILSQAAAANPAGQQRPPAKTVVAALLEAEKTAKQQRLRYPFSSLQGTWRLCFTTGTRKAKRGGIALGNGFYMPKLAPAYITFAAAHPAAESQPELGEITNQIQLATVKLRLTGLCRYSSPKNLLAFDFNHMQIAAFNRPLYQGAFRGGKEQAEKFSQLSIAKLPFFAFFCVTEGYIAARGRGGGLALWRRES
ncbi:MAG: hypothetical protein HY785_20040 [Oscillatoriophycideae cyanobacterium NC_groundwater_1537_Pr4_S-0.65um_50_18]|nr:hypothetical protein [Oscillatoriophycideae cyanobacterium NC_groundwater_1537_Pr4_S-0.65um_50_18]